MLNRPIIFFLFSLLVLWLAAQIGVRLRRRRALRDEDREDFGVVQAAALTLLGLIIGFSFSMAIAGTISARITRKPKPMRLEPNMSGQVCCLQRMRRECVPAQEISRAAHFVLQNPQ